MSIPPVSRPLSWRKVSRLLTVFYLALALSVGNGLMVLAAAVTGRVQRYTPSSRQAVIDLGSADGLGKYDEGRIELVSRDNPNARFIAANVVVIQVNPNSAVVEVREKSGVQVNIASGAQVVLDIGSGQARREEESRLAQLESQQRTAAPGAVAPAPQASTQQDSAAELARKQQELAEAQRQRNLEQAEANRLLQQRELAEAQAREARRQQELAQSQAERVQIEQNRAAAAQKRQELEQALAAETLRQQQLEAAIAAEAQRQQALEQQLAVERRAQEELAAAQAAAELEKQRQLEAQIAAEEERQRRLEAERLAAAQREQQLLAEAQAAEAQRQQELEAQIAAENERQRRLEAERQAAIQREQELLAATQAAEAQRQRELEAQIAAENKRQQRLEAERQAAEAAEAERQRALAEAEAAEAEKQRQLEAAIAAEQQRQQELAAAQAAEQQRQQELAAARAAEAKEQQELAAAQAAAEAAQAQQSAQAQQPDPTQQPVPPETRDPFELAAAAYRGELNPPPSESAQVQVPAEALPEGVREFWRVASPDSVAAGGPNADLPEDYLQAYRLAQVDPTPTHHYNFAQLLIDYELPDRALLWLETAEETFPQTQATSEVYRAIALADMGESEKALYRLDQANLQDEQLKAEIESYILTARGDWSKVVELSETHRSPLTWNNRLIAQYCSQLPLLERETSVPPTPCPNLPSQLPSEPTAEGRQAIEVLSQETVDRYAQDPYVLNTLGFLALQVEGYDSAYQYYEALAQVLEEEGDTSPRAARIKANAINFLSNYNQNYDFLIDQSQDLALLRNQAGQARTASTVGGVGAIIAGAAGLLSPPAAILGAIRAISGIFGAGRRRRKLREERNTLLDQMRQTFTQDLGYLPARPDLKPQQLLQLTEPPAIAQPAPTQPPALKTPVPSVQSSL